MYLGMATERIRACNFYGSPELAVAMGFTSQDAVVPGDLTPEVELELEELLAAAFKPMEVTGGPGFSQKTAWLLPQGTDVNTVLAALPSCIKVDSPVRRQRSNDEPLHFQVCDVVAELKGESYKLELWFCPAMEK